MILLGLGDLSGVAVLPGAKLKAGRGAGLADRLALCWFAAISSSIGCVGLGLGSDRRSAPGWNEKLGSGGGFCALRGAELSCILSADEGLSSVC